MAKYDDALNIVLIDERMEQLGITPAQLAEKIHANTTAINNWFKGKQSPTWQNVVALANALDLPRDEVLIHNPHRITDMQVRVYENVMQWVEEAQRGQADQYRKNAMKTASDILSAHVEKLDFIVNSYDSRRIPEADRVITLKQAHKAIIESLQKEGVYEEVKGHWILIPNLDE